MTPHPDPPLSLRDAVASAVGKRPVSWHRPRTGLSAAHRYVVGLSDGSRLFVKAAVDDETEGWLRTEHGLLTELADDFLARPVAWVENTERPILITEDLSHAHWPADHDPVRWEPGQHELLFETLRRVGAVAAPEWLPSAGAAAPSRWRSIEREADRFLALGLCSESWFREAIPGLVDAEEGLSLQGDALVHGDVRSDNLCFQEDRTVLVDWSNACRGRPDQDLAAVASTLPLEGGPDPVTVMPAGGGWAAYHAGLASRRAYRDERAPEWLRLVLQRLAAINLKWASQALDLPPWTGVDWRDVR